MKDRNNAPRFSECRFIKRHTSKIANEKLKFMDRLSARLSAPSFSCGSGTR